MIWTSFDRVNEDKNLARCKKCDKKLSKVGGSTSGLWNHLKKHNIFRKTTKEQPIKKQKLITDFVKVDDKCLNIEKEYAEMATIKISFKAIAESESIKAGLKARNFGNIQNTGLGVRNKIHQFATNTIEIDKKMLNEERKSKKFVLALDEWTSVRKKRYLGVVLYYKKDQFLKLGLKRIKGKASGPNLKIALEEKLNEFDLSFDDVFAIITDGNK